MQTLVDQLKESGLPEEDKHKVFMETVLMTLVREMSIIADCLIKISGSDPKGE